MSGLILSSALYMKSVTSVMVTKSDDDFIFGLDWQFVFDACIMAVAMLALFALMSYLLFNPARNLLKKRQEIIENDLTNAAKDKEDAAQLKAQYSEKLANADKEADEILSASRKKAMKRENQIIDEAKLEAGRIIDRAGKEAELEKSKMKDEVRKKMISVATAMAGKFVAQSMDDNTQTQLIDETLKEMGDETWQN